MPRCVASCCIPVTSRPDARVRGWFAGVAKTGRIVQTCALRGDFSRCAFLNERNALVGIPTTHGNENGRPERSPQPEWPPHTSRIPSAASAPNFRKKPFAAFVGIADLSPRVIHDDLSTAVHTVDSSLPLQAMHFELLGGGRRRANGRLVVGWASIVYRG